MEVIGDKKKIMRICEFMSALSLKLTDILAFISGVQLSLLDVLNDLK